MWGRETHPDWCVEKGKTLVGKASCGLSRSYQLEKEGVGSWVAGAEGSPEDAQLEDIQKAQEDHLFTEFWLSLL